jgi:hypothetical protein
MPASRQTSAFLNQFPGFEAIPAQFRGVVEISSTVPLAAMTFRVRTNERGEILIAPIPSSNELRLISMFPHLALGDGFEMDLIWVSRPDSPTQTGTAFFYSNFGSTLPLADP